MNDAVIVVQSILNVITVNMIMSCRCFLNSNLQNSELCKNVALNTLYNDLHWINRSLHMHGLHNSIVSG